jgi:hypothetical protein
MSRPDDPLQDSSSICPTNRKHVLHRVFDPTIGVSDQHKADDRQIPLPEETRFLQGNEAEARSLECDQVLAIIPAPQAQVAELADALG